MQFGCVSSKSRLQNIKVSTWQIEEKCIAAFDPPFCLNSSLAPFDTRRATHETKTLDQAVSRRQTRPYENGGMLCGTNNVSKAWVFRSNRGQSRPTRCRRICLLDCWTRSGSRLWDARGKICMDGGGDSGILAMRARLSGRHEERSQYRGQNHWKELSE
jgi:hypothetical protein